MDRDSIRIVVKIIIDFLCLFIVGMGVLMFYLYGQPYKRGFFCSDESLKYPYIDSTVTSTMLYITGLFLPICVMILGEFGHSKKQRGQSARVFLGYTIPPWIWMAYYHIGIFGFGAACTTLITDVGKYSIGRLRPHFQTVCNTTACSLPSNQGVYVEDFECNSNIYGAKEVRDARLSFPSGHSSFSAYTMLYLILYLQLRIQWNNTKLIKHMLQLICLIMAWFTALSRVSNYKHHWSDVLAGSTLGVIVALVVANYIAGLFKKENTEKSGDQLHQTEYETEGTQNESSPLRNPSTRYGGVTGDS